ncbi:hypothetical protein [Rhodococcus sp. H29-C3]|uniref:hypothetical protein n=1 Tax=Rhodococcus sp. H29-C3 TaxID=3046307 RepID=UPI0024BA329F|nr:hypothetical protein [Rhodococcus sp. H29-C3]MDJ0360544.1 hypothetical protein [Rhodococcus sp. H29-C3]
MPTDHRYITNLAPDTVDMGEPAFFRLPDPRPVDAEETENRWWPPRWLEPRWLTEHIDTFDVFHLHFGFDAVEPARLAAIVEILRAHDKPFVLTVHDLHNPHFADNSMHLAQLDILVTAADDVITLTHAAAAAITARWNTPATVLPHPHVAPLDLIGPARAEHEREFVIGIHAKSLRANLDPLAVMDVVVCTAAELGNARVQLDIDEEVFAHRNQRGAVGAALTAYNRFRSVDVRVHRRFDDTELWRYLKEIDVSVLPYRFGTHSGWLEACYDLGTAVVAPDCGYYGDQKPCTTYEFGIDRFEPDTLAQALRDVHAARGRIPAASRVERERERTMLSRRHYEIYERALSRGSRILTEAR